MKVVFQFLLFHLLSFVQYLQQFLKHPIIYIYIYIYILLMLIKIVNNLILT